MSDFRLETQRLVLRAWREEDVARFVALTNTPAVMRWLGGMMDEETIAALFARMDAFQQRYGHCFWIVERTSDGGHLAGEMLGFCGLKRADAPGSTFPGQFEIGWRLREDAWGQGYAREAASASLEAAFTRFAAPEVIAITIIENTASWGLMERLGMTRRTDLDYRDSRFDPPFDATVAWSIDAQGWERSRKR